MENDERNHDIELSIDRLDSSLYLQANENNQLYQEERIRQNLDQLLNQRNNQQPEESQYIRRDQFQQDQLQQNNHCCVLNFSTAIAKYELVYFFVLIVQLLMGVKVPNVCLSWIVWYIFFGTCWNRNNDNGCLLILSQIFKLIIVFWGICNWINEPLNILVYLFLLLNVDSIVRIPVMICTSCIVCVCASGFCFLCIKIKLQLKSKNQKKKKFLETLKDKEKIIMQKTKIYENFRNGLQMSDQILSYSSQLNNNFQSKDSQNYRCQQNKQECPICLTYFEDKYVQIECKHKFHYQCLKTWLQTSTTCPICRKLLY